MGSKIHAILAVEDGARTLMNNTISGTINLFTKKTEHFWGSTKMLSLFGEDTPEKIQLENAEREFKKIETTVPAELKFLGDIVTKFIDVMYQKDEGNQRAKADIFVGDRLLAKDVPATTLLGLEAVFKNLRNVLSVIPTLQPGIDWYVDPSLGDYIYKDANPEILTKKKKLPQFLITVQPTDKHPAQVKEWTEDVDIGTYTKMRWSSMISVADKSKLLAKLDVLIESIKTARSKANETELTTAKIGNQLLTWLLSDVVK